MGMQIRPRPWVAIKFIICGVTLRQHQQNRLRFRGLHRPQQLSVCLFFISSMASGIVFSLLFIFTVILSSKISIQFIFSIIIIHSFRSGGLLPYAPPEEDILHFFCAALEKVKSKILIHLKKHLLNTYAIYSTYKILLNITLRNSLLMVIFNTF